MMPEGRPSEFTRTLYGCEQEDISGVVILTPLYSAHEDLKGRAESLPSCTHFTQKLQWNSQ
jgi:hypothetical protein